MENKNDDQKKNKKLKFKKYILLILVVFIVFSGFILIEENKIKNMTIEENIEFQIENMSIKEKINQMMFLSMRYTIEDNEIIGLTKLSAKDKSFIRKNNPGGIILFNENIDNELQLTNLVKSINNSYKKIPGFIGIDEEGGEVSNLKSIIEAEPSARDIALTGEKENAYISANNIGKILREYGINVNFAPVCDIQINNSTLGTRTFGEDVDTVIEFSSAFIKGLRDNNIMGAAKHFPGYGSANGDSHLELPIVKGSKETILSRELKPFINSINEGIEMIMVGHMIIPELDTSNLPSTLSKSVVTGLLKNELGYDGIVITDAMDMKAITNTYLPEEAAKLAINAGCDMILMPMTIIVDANDKEYENFINKLVTYVKNGEIKIERINDAVRRILITKAKNGVE